MNLEELMINDIVIATVCHYDDITDEDVCTEHPARITDISPNRLIFVKCEERKSSVEYLDDCDSEFDDLKPMPLTPEFFELNGFVSNECYNFFWRYNCGVYLLQVHPLVGRIEIYEQKGDSIVGEPNRVIRTDSFGYVHQFQHALRLLGLTELANGLKAK